MKIENSDLEIADLEIINQFAISLLRQNSLEDLLWSMASNLGEVLGFEDCVIYLCQGDELIQYAAHGVKNPAPRNIKNQIRLPIGKGIVGSVALNRTIEYVPDLSGDSRYIQDEFGGNSELAVPLLFEGEVIAVVDSESSRIDGFSPRDISLLESLANIAAPRVASAIHQRDKEIVEAQLREAKIEAENANRAKSEFLSRMSHELKTPLNAILGFANILRIEAGDNPDSRVDKIIYSGRHLLSLVNESLDILKVEQNHISLDLKYFDVGEVIVESLAMLQSDADQQGIRLETSLLHIGLEADRQRLQQVLLNLLSNAIKYNRPDGTVLVSTLINDEQQLVLSVEDTGVGISASDLEKLFKPFTRFGPLEKNVEGHGVGMMISRQLLEAMGGCIKVSSEPGVGTRVEVLFPQDRYDVRVARGPDRRQQTN